MKVKVGGNEKAIPPGEYRARVLEISPGTFQGKRRTFVFRFEIAEGPHTGVVMRAFVNGHYESFSAFSKLYKWYAAVTKEQLEPGMEMDLDNFLEKILLVKVESRTSRKTDNVFSNVTDILSVICEV